MLAALCAVAFAAGFIDAIAGGGGLLTLPALLAAGLSPQLALGTNKGQAVWGSGSALLGFVRLGLVDRRTAPTRFAAAFVGSLGGAVLVTFLAPTVLRPVVLVLLVVVGLVLALRPPLTDGPVRARPAWIGLALALVLGAYDGFFGPGTGTFLIVGQVWLLGAGLLRASAEAKVANFGSNLAALLVFASAGSVSWRLAIPLGLAQLVGGFLGARVAVRGGERLVRWLLLAVVVALVAKLAFDEMT